MGIKLKAGLWCTLALLLAGYLAVLFQSDSLNIDSNILSLLPATDTDPAVEQAFNRFSEQSTRKLAFFVVNPDKSAAQHAADELSALLQTSAGIGRVELKHQETEQDTTSQFYFEYRHHLLSRQDAKLLDARNYESFSEDSIRLAYAPFPSGLINLLQKDPFLLSYRAGINDAGVAAPGLLLDDGYLLAEVNQEFHVLVTAELNQSPFNQDLQEQLSGALASLEHNWATAAPGTRLIRTGALFYAAHAYETANFEVSFIGGLSLLLIIILLLMAFRNGWPVAFVLVALGMASATGYAVVRLLFGEVQLLAIVFGASLIGVAEDYVFHYFSIDNANSGEARLRRIFPSITISLVTTMLGYAALLFTPFPGLQQMAVFCISGLVAAYLTVVWLFPLLDVRTRNSPAMLQACRHFLAVAGHKSARAMFYLALLMPAVALGYLYVGKHQAEDVRNFQAQDASLQAQEKIIQQILNAPVANQFYLVKGKNPEQLLTNLEDAQGKLDELVQQGVMDGYVSVATWLPSIRTQARNYQQYQRLYDSDAGHALVAAGLISQQQLDEVKKDFAAHSEHYVLPQTWLSSPVGAESAYLWQAPAPMAADSNSDAPQGFAALIALRGIKQLGLLTDFSIGPDAKAVFIDKISTINALIAAYRDIVARMLLATCGVIFLVLWFRYRVRKALLMLASPVIAIAMTILGMAVLGESLSLFSILSLFLVIGFGIDIGIFFAEDNELHPETLLAVILSEFTTIFSFGLLALSSTPVIHSFGLSMLIGLSTTLLLAPVIGHMIVKRTTAS